MSRIRQILTGLVTDGLDALAVKLHWVRQRSGDRRQAKRA